VAGGQGFYKKRRKTNKAKMIKAVIFDFGGVLKRPQIFTLETRDIASAYNVQREVIIEKGRLFLEPLRKGLITENQFWKQFSLALNKKVPKNKKDLLRKSYQDRFYIYPKIVSFIKVLKKEGIKTAVLSNTIEPHVEIITQKGGYKGFDVVVLSCREHLQKPDKDIYLLAIKRLGVKPKECIFIDDKEDNLKTAKRLKIKTVLFKNQKQVIDDVSRIIDSENKT
jgi:putative hydrolase of the HAD superfamily